jgi:hypothetical protein
MASDNEDPETVADRLEAALTRIAQAAASRAIPPDDPTPPFDTQEIAARLDGLIDRLRVALSMKAG